MREDAGKSRAKSLTRLNCAEVRVDVQVANGRRELRRGRPRGWTDELALDRTAEGGCPYVFLARS